MQKYFKKLKSQRGESLSETLIAVAITSFALLVLATMIFSSANIMDKSKKKYAAYVEGLNRVTLQEDDDSDGNGTVTFDGNDYTVKYYVYTFNGKTIVSYK